jgi:SAM-dependent methyltransferase
MAYPKFADRMGTMTDSLTEIARTATSTTIGYYDQHAPAFWDGTKDHDVTQNYDALLGAINTEPPFSLLDFGCGPGRDLAYFSRLGHNVTGLDGSTQFAEMAKAHSGAEVWVQDFINLSLPANRFDGVFANATLFHVPKNAIEDSLSAIWSALKPNGVLFTSNPRGNDEEGLSGGRFGVYYRDETWMALLGNLKVKNGCFKPVRQYYRPQNVPPDQQRWFATLWRKSSHAAK